MVFEKKYIWFIKYIQIRHPMLFLILRKKYQLFFLLVSITFSVNAQVVLNEIYVRPDGLSTTAPNGLIYTGSKEYVELYNKGCTTVNVSVYF